MKVFYRLQLENGEGVYRTLEKANPNRSKGIKIVEEFMGDMNSSRHPTPSSDSLLGKNLEKIAGLEFAESLWDDGKYIPNGILKPYIFGFTSKDQFFSWFYNKPCLDALKEVGYNLYRLTNPKTLIKGNAQAVIKKEEWFSSNEIEKVEI